MHAIYKIVEKIKKIENKTDNHKRLLNTNILVQIITYKNKNDALEDYNLINIADNL